MSYRTVVVVAVLIHTKISGVVQHVSWLHWCGISSIHHQLSISVLAGYTTINSLHRQITSIKVDLIT